MKTILTFGSRSTNLLLVDQQVSKITRLTKFQRFVRDERNLVIDMVADWQPVELRKQIVSMCASWHLQHYMSKTVLYTLQFGYISFRCFVEDGVAVIQARANHATSYGICHVNSKIFLYVPQ